MWNYRGNNAVLLRYASGTSTPSIITARGLSLAPTYATKYVCQRDRNNSCTAKPVMSAGQHKRHSYHGFTLTDTAYSNIVNTSKWRVTKIMSQLSSYDWSD